MNKTEYVKRLWECYNAALSCTDTPAAMDVLTQIRELTKGDNTTAQHKTVNPPEGYTTAHIIDNTLAASPDGPMLMLDPVNEEWVPLNWKTL